MTAMVSTTAWALISVLTAASFWAVPVGASPGPVDSFTFSLHDPDGGGIVGPQSGATALKPEHAYEVVISGAFSVWSVSSWRLGSCPSATIHSNPPAGVDPEYVFAAPREARQGCSVSAVPLHVPNLELSTDGASTWHHVEPRVEDFNPRHSYTYRVAGQGFPIQVRYVDFPSADNYGSLLVAVIESPGEDPGSREEAGNSAPSWVALGGAIALLGTGAAVLSAGRQRADETRRRIVRHGLGPGEDTRLASLQRGRRHQLEDVTHDSRHALRAISLFVAAVFAWYWFRRP